jgi:O-Antigen ligase
MPRGLLIFALCLPLAILMGFMVADPLMGRNMMVIGGVILALLIPLALSIHHTALIWLAGAYMNAFFLPGKPHMWMVFAALSFGISALSWPMAKNRLRPVWDNSVFASLVFIFVVLVATAAHSGGIGLNVLGSATIGGRKYIWILAAIFGFVALTMSVVPRQHAQREMTAFTLAPITAAVGNMAYMLGPGFYWLFLLFPVEMAMGQAMADYSPLMVSVKRYSGLGPASIGIVMFCLCKFGYRGMLRLDKAWRLLLVLGALFLGALSGFRSIVAICFIVGLVQFFAEGMHRTKYAAGLAGLAAGVFLFLAAFADTLPLSVQRTLSFLPIKVDPVAAMDAAGSLQWRFDMWSAVAREIPKHFWVGKGYTIDPTDLYFANEASRRGFDSGHDAFVAAGDYHSGPLSILIPFGIFGALGFAWFFVASIKVLWRNMRYGDPELKSINTFLFSFFVGRLIFFIVFFGAIETDFWMFASTVGVGLSINGGPCQKPQAPRLQAVRRNREVLSGV